MSGVLASYALGIGAVVAMSLAWVAVMTAWRRMFRPGAMDPDPLAERLDCHGCGCAGTSSCERRSEMPDSAARSARAIDGDARAGLANPAGP